MIKTFIASDKNAQTYQHLTNVQFFQNVLIPFKFRCLRIDKICIDFLFLKRFNTDIIFSSETVSNQYGLLEFNWTWPMSQTSPIFPTITYNALGTKCSVSFETTTTNINFIIINPFTAITFERKVIFIFARGEKIVFLLSTLSLS